MPTAMISTGTIGSGPYRASTRATVAINGTTAAEIHRTRLEATNFESQMALRDTGFEAVHASVPLSRSAVMIAITAKMAATTKIWLETPCTRFMNGSRT